EILLPMHEQRAEHRTQVRAAPDAYPLDRLNGVDHPLPVDVDARRAQHAAEQQQVGDERHASARARIVLIRSPRTLSMSSWFLAGCRASPPLTPRRTPCHPTPRSAPPQPTAPKTPPPWRKPTLGASAPTPRSAPRR